MKPQIEAEGEGLSMLNIGISYKPIDPEIQILADKYGGQPEAVLEVLRALHERRGGLSQDAIRDVARALNIPQEQAYGVASFYAMLSIQRQEPQTIRVCDGPPCWLRGAKEVRAAADAEFGAGWTVGRTSCLGLCDRAPAALVNNQQCGPLAPEHISQIKAGWRGDQHIYGQPRTGEVRVLLAGAGEIDPLSIDSALAHGAYQGLKSALEGSLQDVIEEVIGSGVRGRGGAGFPVGQKWRFVALQERSPKYIVCNADESEPLVFKDRVLIDTNPHKILEGMAIAAYAVRAEEGFIYIRGEYESQALTLEHAIHEAEQQGYLGEKILNKDFSFHIHVHRGAGAYICGEETALLESLEGKRGEPRTRPPYPTVNGYHGLPTVVNNVESFATIPGILSRGAAWYQGLGDPQSPGTKLYTLLGHINRPGLFEAPYGLTLRQIIEEYGEGMQAGSNFNFALTGGAAGTVVPPALLDIPINYKSGAQGVSLGAGAFLICDQSVSPVALLRELLHFFEVESCGKCTPCRIGTHQARQILDGMLAGDRHLGGVEALLELADVLEKDSFCGLGQSASWPMRSAIKHFEAAFSAGK
ncbi:MAG: NADH-quinone oxidoreductase subunit NuoF [Anaerolineales bacterium]|jgi:NADH:ubiquinone oxidoreductase subunit F (NADH-binding)/NADH:ubiquinone oxidoreductase subunit E